MDKPKVILTRRWPALVERELSARYDLETNPSDRPFSAAELAGALQRGDAVCPTVTDSLDAALIGTPQRRARIVANFGVGFNHIDIAAARAAGLVVTNTPGVLTDCTADLTMTLLLMTARRAGEGERMVRSGAWPGWSPTQLLGCHVSGKTLGLVGFGRIAAAVAHRAHHGFGMRILFYTPRPPPAADYQALQAESCASLEALLARADFVSLHCPGGAATRHLIDATRLACMRPEAFLINTARGEVVDESALIAALEGGRIAGAGLDVYGQEPRLPDALLRLENAVLLPHLGSAAMDTRIAMGRRAMTNLEAFFAGGDAPDRVA